MGSWQTLLVLCKSILLKAFFFLAIRFTSGLYLVFGESPVIVQVHFLEGLM